MTLLKRASVALFGALIFFPAAIPNALAASAAIAKHHMVVAADPYAAEAGLIMLRAGGSAVDAAIAVQMVLNLVEPQSSGIGGGGFLLVAEPNGALTGYDGREVAPSSAKPDMFMAADGKPMRFRDAVPGGLSVGVPGALAMLAKAHTEHGKLPWAKLFEPAILLAENGFKVPPRLGAEIASFLADSMMPDVRAAFFHADGTPLRVGEIVKNPAFAQSLRAIAKDGPDAFYKGALAQQIVNAVNKAPRNPAGMTLADLANYTPKTRPATCAPYRKYRLCELQAGNGGVTVLEILGLLQRFKPEDLKPGTLSAVHLISEAEKLAYADRQLYLGDPDFVTAPVAGLLDANYLGQRAQDIDPAHAMMAPAKAGTPPVKRAERRDFAPQAPQLAHGTSHFTVVDDRGEVISMTTSIESGFGSKVMAGGFLLNNELTDFSFAPEMDGKPVANAVAPGKRPLSAMSPTIIFGPDGKFFAAIGSPGGRTIIAYVAQAVVALIDGQSAMPDAVALPHHVNTNGATVLETGTVLESMAPQLTALGHQVRSDDQPSGLNGIRRVPGGYEGGSDPRRDGVALGD